MLDKDAPGLTAAKSASSQLPVILGLRYEFRKSPKTWPSLTN
jgi:hypothetical protein